MKYVPYQKINCFTSKAEFDNSEQFVFIDVREDHEWIVSHIPKAIHIGRNFRTGYYSKH